jgi:hypothetical protein
MGAEGASGASATDLESRSLGMGVGVGPRCSLANVALASGVGVVGDGNHVAADVDSSLVASANVGSSVDASGVGKVGDVRVTTRGTG